MEQFTIKALGLDSSRWEKLLDVSKEKLEILEHTFFIDDGYKRPKPLSLVLKTEKLWIEWAMERGDKTYLEFTDGPLIPQLRLYDNSIDRGKDIDDGYIWNNYRKHKGIEGKGGGVVGKSEEALITCLEDTE